MAVYEYRDQRLDIPDNDSEYRGYFEAAGEHRLVVKKCRACNRLRGEPGPGCPWCPSLDWDWQEVSGKGTIYSYQIIAHTVIPSFRDMAPFAIVLVELDEQIPIYHYPLIFLYPSLSTRLCSISYSTHIR